MLPIPCRVKCKNYGEGRVRVGDTGTLLGINKFSRAAVEWDKESFSQHDCITKSMVLCRPCKKKHGYFVNLDTLEFIQEEDFPILLLQDN